MRAYNPGDKVWVRKQQRTYPGKPNAPVPLGSEMPGTVYGYAVSSVSGAVGYRVWVQGVADPNGSMLWFCVPEQLRPRHDEGDFPEMQSISDSNPNSLSHWGRNGTWVPERVKRDLMKKVLKI